MDDVRRNSVTHRSMRRSCSALQMVPKASSRDTIRYSMTFVGR